MRPECGKIRALKVIETASGKGINRWMTAGMCLALSVVLHVIIAIMLCLRVLILKTEVVEVVPPEKKETVISIKLDPAEPPKVIEAPKVAPLTPQELKALAVNKPPPEKKPLVDQPKPKEIPRYTRTSDDQLSGKVPETSLQSERDTIAASNADAVARAQERSSVRGEEADDRPQETVDTTFQDGAFEHMNKGSESSEARIVPPSELESESKKIADKRQEEVRSSVQPTKEMGDALETAKLAESNKESKEFLDTQKKIALNEELPTTENKGQKEKKGVEEAKKTIANKQPDPDGLKQKAQEKKQQKPNSQPKTAQNKRASEAADKGFRSQAKATVMEGTISRRSKVASENAKSTPVGKYMAQISKLVEQEWQRRCMMHADLIQPGTLRIGFMVDENGKVKNINTITQTLGSENQRSLTYQALMTVKIPPMPQKVKGSQGGDPLEFRYYFRFQ